MPQAVATTTAGQYKSKLKKPWVDVVAPPEVATALLDDAGSDMDLEDEPLQAQGPLLFFAVSDWTPAEKKRLPSMRATTTPLLESDIAIVCYDVVGDIIGVPEAGQACQVQLRRCSQPTQIVRWGTLMGKHTILRDHLLVWQRDTEGLSVIVAGHPDVDTRVITMLLEAHACPGFSGLLKVVNASAGAVDVLRGCAS